MVPISGLGFSTVTVWPSSVMSVWAAIPTPSWLRVSNATSSVPSGMIVASNVNVTFTLPSGESGMNVVLPETGLPSASNRGSSVILPSSSTRFTWRVPVSVYSSPGMRFVYSTVSTIVAFVSAVTVLSPSAPSVAVVPISGAMTRSCWSTSSLSLCSAMRVPSFTRYSSSNTVTVLPPKPVAGKVVSTIS